jgi:hypothetical protein
LIPQADSIAMAASTIIARNFIEISSNAPCVAAM